MMVTHDSETFDGVSGIYYDDENDRIIELTNRELEMVVSARKTGLISFYLYDVRTKVGDRNVFHKRVLLGSDFKNLILLEDLP